MTAIVYETAHAKRIKPAVQPNGSEVVAVRFEFDLTAALLITDVIKLGWLPANCKVVDWLVDSDDLSDSAAGTFTLGIHTNVATPLVDATASGGAMWVTASTLMQAGGVVRPIIAAHTRMVVSRTTDQLIAVTMAASCTVTATGKFGVTVWYQAA